MSSARNAGARSHCLAKTRTIPQVLTVFALGSLAIIMCCTVSTRLNDVVRRETQQNQTSFTVNGLQVPMETALLAPLTLVGTSEVVPPSHNNCREMLASSEHSTHKTEH
jgi:hypothetical protein